MEIMDKINKLMENEEFRNAFAAVTDPQGVVELFGANGIEVPYNIAEELFQPELPEGEELSDEVLENVAGGFGTSAGAAIGNGIFYGAGYLGARLAGWDDKKTKQYAKVCGGVGAALGGAIGSLICPG